MCPQLLRGEQPGGEAPAYRAVWVLWSQEGSEFGAGKGCLPRTGRGTAYWIAPRSHFGQLWNIPWVVGTLEEWQWAWGFWSAPGGGQVTPLTEIFLPENEVP